MISLAWILLLVVCVVVWTRETKEPFDTKRINDFFDLANPYMEEKKKTFIGLKNI